jgi:hypothetical protein
LPELLSDRLIVQDIVAILMMVLLSTIAVSQQFSGSELIDVCFKTGFLFNGLVFRWNLSLSLPFLKKQSIY